MVVKFLTEEHLEKLTTKRLIAYKNKLMAYPEGPSWEEGNVKRLNKSDDIWKDQYSLVKKILSTRENVEGFGADRFRRGKNK